MNIPGIQGMIANLQHLLASLRALFSSWHGSIIIIFTLNILKANMNLQELLWFQFNDYSCCFCKAGSCVLLCHFIFEWRHFNICFHVCNLKCQVLEHHIKLHFSHPHCSCLSPSLCRHLLSCIFFQHANFGLCICSSSRWKKVVINRCKLLLL